MQFDTILGASRARPAVREYRKRNEARWADEGVQAHQDVSRRYSRQLGTPLVMLHTRLSGRKSAGG